MAQKVQKFGMVLPIVLLSYLKKPKKRFTNMPMTYSKQ
ncbi:hypothetical protein STRCR_1584 [Streptococcus criceti HS-6]|uniref:Uncharacterized protein n=1 Tax=Streptococcus criceti HS-6 TaxID=873449 RepID=G5JPD2_STRCG|nr:hypothetical protein STRCR_1584 [Streptococcus criceti HS-6]